MSFWDLRQGRFYQGDCLEVMSQIPDGVIDMVLCDLPYGTTQNKWDTIIPFDKLWEQYWRVCKDNAAIVLTAAQPFTSALVMSEIKNFKYCYVWDTFNKYSNYLNAKKQPMRRHEDICVFYRKQPVYNPQMEVRDEVFKSRRTKTRSTESYGEFKGDDYGRETMEKTPCSVIVIPGRSTKKAIHPTQKPVELFEYLIRTYTNEGAIVLDNCAGSGTTAIAAINTNRKWCCIEQDETYAQAALKRIEEHVL